MVDKIRVIIVDRQKEVKIPTGIRMLVRRCCNAVLSFEEFKGSAEVSVTFVDNAYIQSLNAQYRNKNVPTDVLSFPMGKEDGTYEVDPESNAQLLGDIVVSMEMVLEQSKSHGHSLREEVAYLVVHGMLHLLGYDHERGGFEETKMRESELRIMNALGFPNAISYILNQ